MQRDAGAVGLALLEVGRRLLRPRRTRSAGLGTVPLVPGPGSRKGCRADVLGMGPILFGLALLAVIVVVAVLVAIMHGQGVSRRARG